MVRFDDHAGRFDDHAGRFDDHAGRFDDHAGRFDDQFMAEIKVNFSSFTWYKSSLWPKYGKLYNR